MAEPARGDELPRAAQRRSLLRGEGIGEVMGGFIYVTVVAVVFWVAGFWFLHREIAKAKSEGSLGSF